MTRKQLSIVVEETCEKCPFRSWRSAGSSFGDTDSVTCFKTGDDICSVKRITAVAAWQIVEWPPIPSWCPLPDAQAEAQNQTEETRAEPVFETVWDGSKDSTSISGHMQRVGG